MYSPASLYQQDFINFKKKIKYILILILIKTSMQVQLLTRELIRLIRIDRKDFRCRNDQFYPFSIGANLQISTHKNSY